MFKDSGALGPCFSNNSKVTEVKTRRNKAAREEKKIHRRFFHHCFIEKTPTWMANLRCFDDVSDFKEFCSLM